MVDNSSDAKNSEFQIKLPVYRRPKLELWREIDPNNSDTLLGCFEIDDYEEFFHRLETNNIKLDHNVTNNVKPDRYHLFKNLISKLLKLNLSNRKDLILIDQYYYLTEFSLNKKFNKEQINILLSIARRTHDLAIESSFGNLDQTFDYFKNSLLIYAVHRPPFSLNFFSPKQIELILNYFLDTYFNQFKFYKYVFTRAVRLNLEFEYKNLEKDIRREENDSNQVGLLLENELEALNSGDNNNNNNNLTDRNESRLSPILDDESNSNVEQMNELKEFVKKYLNEKMIQVKKDILVENNADGTELRGKSGGTNRNTSGKKKNSAKKK
jgi:hypothetical protein